MNSSGRLKEQAFLIQIFTVLPLPLSSLTSVAIMDLFPEYVVAGMGFHFVVWGLLILLMLKTLSYLPRFLRIFIVVGTVCILLSIFFSGMVPETGIKKAMLLIVSVFPGFLASVMLVQLSLIQCYTDN
ncbi:hypothetical protein ACES2I_15600 [Bdellovibrio bacteriovorus]|uniref:hypothetical protein n=1 Tax=Bdellovibrio bacteriovorus TaxID=959 RepID=UPI0035A5FE96